MNDSTSCRWSLCLWRSMLLNTGPSLSFTSLPEATTDIVCSTISSDLTNSKLRTARYREAVRESFSWKIPIDVATPRINTQGIRSSQELRVIRTLQRYLAEFTYRSRDIASSKRPLSNASLSCSAKTIRPLNCDGRASCRICRS